MPRLLNDDILLEIFNWFASIDDDCPFTIFFLSKAWRQTVIGHPDLWSYIAVDMTREDWQERVHIAITLSQSRPLHLKIVCQGRIHPELLRFQSSFTRIQTIILHTLDGDKLMSNLQYVYDNKMINNID
ncbi:hypothetical protein FRB91_005744 [Serendipita sp. 411]|nr:hypothetical protein FRC16_003030 [Serendipita sp. 398]KAG8802554.1 hypothetical protein FRC18_007521 [Serendipita sp. 400]KAG8840711.1 hypothetical protein FRB91_005744 [Serendipita sp. 411]KAG8849630.1 hypothetical protein FRC20_002264 [Serendipita sp. 405]